MLSRFNVEAKISGELKCNRLIYIAQKISAEKTGKEAELFLTPAFDF